MEPNNEQMNGEHLVKKEGIPISADDVELLKKQRDLVLPSARIAAFDDFAKWLFTIITVISALGAAASNTVLKSLSGKGTVMFFLAIALTGIALAIAIILRTIEPKDPNWQSLPDMLAKTKKALEIKQTMAWIAGGLFSLAIVLAGMSPLLSEQAPVEKPMVAKGFSFSYGKDGVHVVAIFPGAAGAAAEIRVLAVLPNDEILIGAQRSNADQQGTIRLDVGSLMPPTKTTAIKIKLGCTVKNADKKEELFLPLRSIDNEPSAVHLNVSCFD